MSKGIEIIEAKLELGFTHYTAKEVAFLLNQIRVLKELNKKGTN